MPVKPPKIKKPLPFAFVLDELEALAPWTRPMFGCTAIYVEDKIVLILRCKDTEKQDNGVWLATTSDHHASLRREFPSLRSIRMFGPGESGWQVIPESASDFEESVLGACALVRKGDPRIGKVPKKKVKRASSQARRASSRLDVPSARVRRKKLL